MRGDFYQLDTSAIGHVAAIRSHQWTPRTTATGGKRTHNPRHLEPRPKAIAPTSITRQRIAEALTAVPAGMTCTAICAAKKLGKKACEQMLGKMVEAGIVRISGHCVGGMGRRTRVYSLVRHG